MSKYLLIESKNKKLLTYKRNLSQLKELKNIFKVNLYWVEAEGTPLSIQEIAKFLCDQNALPEDVNILKKEPILCKRDRKAILQNSKLIQNYIVTKLSTKKMIALKELKEKFSEFHLSDACFCRHLKTAINQLVDSGWKILKKSRGTYVVV